MAFSKSAIAAIARPMPRPMSGPDGGFGGTGAVRVGDAGDAIAIEHAPQRGTLRHGAGAVP